MKTLIMTVLAVASISSITDALWDASTIDVVVFAATAMFLLLVVQSVHSAAYAA
jgi:hypothetical protein